MVRQLTAFFFILLVITGCQYDQSHPVALTETATPTTVPKLKIGTSTPNECPDVSGIYFDRSISSYKSDGQDDANHVKALFSPKNNNKLCRVGALNSLSFLDLSKRKSIKSVMLSSCSLFYWLDPTHYSPWLLYNRDVTKVCTVRKVEISKLVNSEFDIKIFENDNVEGLTVDMAAAGYRCQDGKIIILVKGGGSEHSYVINTVVLAPADDGSLIANVYTNKRAILPIIIGSGFIPIPMGKYTELESFRWVRADSDANPYLDCP